MKKLFLCLLFCLTLTTISGYNYYFNNVPSNSSKESGKSGTALVTNKSKDTISLLTADVLIQAGHEGRPESCQKFPQHQCNLGTPGEREWTPIVADEATRILRQAGISVIRKGADFAEKINVEDAVFIHFDGGSKPCTSTASVGYPTPGDRPNSANSPEAAKEWKSLYSKYWLFEFMNDNFTPGLHHYYAFKYTNVSDAKMVIELGEITCPKQREWLSKRLKWEGVLLAHFLSQRIGKGNIPDPGSFAQ